MKAHKHILFFLGHPAHYHLFRPLMSELKRRDYKVTVMIKSKDILADLLDADDVEYINALPKGRKDGVVGIASSVITKALTLYKFCKKYRPDLMMGTSAEIAWVGKLLGIPNLNFNEDDASVVSTYAKIVYPFATAIVSPISCNNGKWQDKTIAYKGFQKLAYLHPLRFKPSKSIVAKYLNENDKFSIIRFAKLNAHHDAGAQGFTTEIARETIRILSNYGKVLISSERPLEPEFEQYRLKINPLDIHHLMHFAQVYTGDSQSMAVEAALLGTPSVRFSSFSGKIGVLEELEHRFKLTIGVQADNPELLYKTLSQILDNPNSSIDQGKLRDEMLAEKIDVTGFFLELIMRFTS